MIDCMFLLDRKPVPMFWPNDSILNRICCVLIELVYEEKGIQRFEMYSLYLFNKMWFWPEN